MKEASEQDRLDRAWVQDVTDLFAVELQRVNHSKTSWAERTLIWRGRSLVYAEKQRLAGDQLTKPSFSSSVLAARRLRAGWEFMAQHRPEQTQRLKERCEHHFDVLEQRGITPYDVDSRPEHLVVCKPRKVPRSVVVGLVWMFGLVTWSALAGNLVPYKLNGWFSKSLKRKDIDTSVVGTMKVLSAIVLFPAWWLLASALITWSLLSSASPLNALLLSHWLLLSITPSRSGRFHRLHVVVACFRSPASQTVRSPRHRRPEPETMEGLEGRFQRLEGAGRGAARPFCGTG